MRVFMINSFFSVGGPPRIVKGIYDVLKENNDLCILAAAREKIIDSMHTTRIGTKITAYRCAILARIFDSEGFNAKKPTEQLIKQIKEYNPDIIHLHNLHGYYINVEILFDFLKKYKKPVIWTLHDCWSVTGHCVHFDYIGCDKWKKGCNKCIQKKEYPTSVFFDNSAENYKRKKAAFTGVQNMTLVPVSKWLEGIIKKSYLSEYPTNVIYNGLDLKHFKPTANTIKSAYGIKNKIMILGVAQNWSKKKGFNDFIKLSSLLNMDKYAIVLVGVPKSLQKKVPHNIICVDQTNSTTELAQFYSAADLFLNLSYEETFGLVTAEALACGTPAIVYNRTAVPEIIDESCGIVVEAGNIKLLKKIITDEKWRAIESNNCIGRAKQYEDKIQYCKYIELYKKILEEGEKL